LLYAKVSEDQQQNKKYYDNKSATPENTILFWSYHEKILSVFRIKGLPLLIKSKNQNASVAFKFSDPAFNCDLSLKISPKPGSNFSSSLKPPKLWQNLPAIFLPTRELLTIYPGFVSLYEGRYLEFDETYYDTCLLLGEPLLKKPNKELLAILETAMNGTVELDSGRFYLVSTDGWKTEMPLVAEGLRKLAMLAQLIAVGALEKGSYLFWDEPEANLNPRLIKVVAKVIVQLADAGIQIFIATHSLFLLRELTILQASQKKPTPQRYFALKKTENGVEVEQGDSIEDLQTLVLLDEELQQSDRYMAVE
jgi:hypothetical protein